MGRMGYMDGRRWRRPPMGYAPTFRPRVGLVVMGLLFLFLAVSLFSHFPPFLFFFGWMIPFFLLSALGAFARSIADRSEGRSSSLPEVSGDRKEKELLGVLARYEEITPARVALETSLSVSEADRMLGELAKRGHIEVRAREGRLVYALWEHDQRELLG